MTVEHRTIGEIAAIMAQRRVSDTLLLRRMIQIRDRYNGDLVLPFPDVKDDPYMKPPVPNLIAEAIDQQAMRANSMWPSITAPPKDVGSDASNAQADRRRRALYGRWSENQLELKLYRAYRHLVGYGTFTMTVMPSDEDGHAVVELRDPLTAYPELRAQDDVREPLNIGFIFSRSIDWIKKHFPNTAPPLVKYASGRTWDTLWDCVEWIDENDIVIGVLGPRQPAFGTQEARVYGSQVLELARWPNKAGCVPVVSPRRLTLDRVMGQLMSVIETTDLFGRVTALDIMAMERAIFPDLVIISKTGGPPQVYSGDWMDGRTGQPNLLSDAVVQNLESSQGPGGASVMANLQAAIQSTGGALGLDQMSGARSGAQVDSLSALNADPRMQESQSIVARALTVINDHIQAVEKAYAPKAKFFLIPGIRGDFTPVEYVPETDFAFTPTLVSYPYSGLDMAGLNVALVQLQGSHLLSRRSTRAASPMVPDGPQEEDQITVEAIDDSILAGIQARVEQDPSFLPVAAHMRTLVAKGTNLAEALIESMSILQTQQPPPGGESTPGAPGAPGPDGQPGPPQLSPAASAMLTAAGQPPGVPSAVPPPSTGLTNEQRLNRAISSKISAGAV